MLYIPMSVAAMALEIFDLNIDPNRLEGEELALELNKVRQQSDEFKRKTEEKEVIRPKKLASFRYVVKNPMGEVVKGIFDAENMTAVRIFLSNEGYEIIEIKAREKWDMDISFGSNKISTGDLSFALMQLATDMKARCP